MIRNCIPGKRIASREQVGHLNSNPSVPNNAVGCFGRSVSNLVVARFENTDTTLRIS